MYRTLPVVSIFGRCECPETITSTGSVRLHAQRLQVMQNVDRLAREAHARGLGVIPSPLAAIHVSADRSDGRNPAERVNDLRVSNVACMNYVVDAR